MKNVKKIFALLLCLCLCAATIMTVSASSEQEDAPEWAVSDDQNTLTYGDEVYTRYDIPLYEWFRPYYLHRYSQKVKTDNSDLNYIGRPMVVNENGELELSQDIVILYEYLSRDSLLRVYVTEKGARMLDAYRAGDYAQYELTYGYSEGSVISGSMVDSWITDAPDMMMEVSELGHMPYYYILGYDSTLTLAHAIGAVFEDNGDYLFVYYDALDNSCFDSNGNLSFRSGSVHVRKLSAADADVVAAAIEQTEYYSPTIEQEEEEPLDASLSMILFLLMASPLLYLLPLILLVLGIVMRCIKKIPGRKRWGTVILSCAIWLGTAVLASAVLLIPTFFL